MTLPIVKRYLIALDQYKWTGLAACILVTCGSYVFAIQPEPATKYQAEGILAYTQPRVIFFYDWESNSTARTDTQQEIVLNREVFEAVIEKVKVDPRQVVKSAEVSLPRPPARGEAPPPPQLKVRFTDADKQRAQAAVNVMMEEAVKQSEKLNKFRLKQTIEEIKKRLPLAEKELREAEKKLEAYIKQEGSVLLAAKNGTLVNGILGSQGQQQAIQFQLQGIETQILSLQQRLGLNPDQAYASSALSADPLIANLRVQIYQTETQLEILRKDLRAEHPSIIQLRKQLKSYENLLQQRAKEVIGGNGLAAPLSKSATQIRQDSSLDPARQALANQLVALQTQKETLQQQLKLTFQQEQKLRREYATIPNKQLEQARLQERLLLKQNLYSKMQASLIDAQAAEAETVSSLFIAKAADILPGELKQTKNVYMIVGIGALVGLAVGGAIIFLLGSLGGVLQTMEDIRALLVQRDVAVLGILPYIFVIRPDRDESPILLASDSPYLELYERFRSNLRRAGEKPPKVVLLTSTSNQEGKSLNAYNLGISSARAGKRTLVIEADLRSPSLAKALKVAPDPDASVEPLRYYGGWNECIRLVPEVENLYLVPSPGPVQQPAAILESSEFRRLLEDVRGRFDMVILDTPALSLCNDALLLEPLTDGIVLVTRPGYTVESMLTEAVDQLGESEDLRLLGAIINGADIAPPAPAIKPQPELLVTEPENLEQQEPKVPTKAKIQQ